jgi:cell division protein FtsB
MDNDAIMKIIPKGREVYRNGGFAKFLETQQKIETKEQESKNYKGQLEITKLELENKKLKYEETIRDLTEENHRLINTNQKFQKYKNIKDLLIFFGVVFGWLLSHYRILEILLKFLVKIVS